MLRWVYLKISMTFVDTSCGIVGEDCIAYDYLHACILYFFSHATAPCLGARLANICKYSWCITLL